MLIAILVYLLEYFYFSLLSYFVLFTNRDFVVQFRQIIHLFGFTCFHLFILLYPPPKLYLIVLYALKLSNVRGSERLRSRLDIGPKLGGQVLLFPIHADTLHPVDQYCPVSITTVFFSRRPRPNYNNYCVVENHIGSSFYVC